MISGTSVASPSCLCRLMSYERDHLSYLALILFCPQHRIYNYRILVLFDTESLCLCYGMVERFSRSFAGMIPNPSKMINFTSANENYFVFCLLRGKVGPANIVQNREFYILASCGLNGS